MPKRMHFARRRKGVTNYRKRLALLKSGLPRAVVRFTNSKVMVQISDFEGKGDRVLASASSADLEKMGWKNSKTNENIKVYVRSRYSKKEDKEIS